MCCFADTDNLHLALSPCQAEGSSVTGRSMVKQSDSANIQGSMILERGNLSSRPALRRSSSTGDLHALEQPSAPPHAKEQPSAPSLSPRIKEFTARERLSFISSGLVPTRTASEEGVYSNRKDSQASPITSPRKTASVGGSPTPPEVRRSSSAEPAGKGIRFLEMDNGKAAFTLNPRTPKPAQETRTSKLRGSLVQSNFLQKKLAIVQSGGIQVRTKHSTISSVLI